MAKYKTLVGERGLNLNCEYFPKETMATFVTAFPAGTVSHFGHANNPLPYPPEVGVSISDAYVKDDFAYADIEFTEDFAQNFKNGQRYDMSIHSKCESHYDEKGVRVIDALVYDPSNALDVVECGAAPSARVINSRDENAGEVDLTQLNCSLNLKVEPISNEREVITLDFTAEQFIELLKPRTESIVTDSATTDPVAPVDVPAVEVTAPVVDNNAVADSFMQGVSAAALPQVVINRIADSIRNGTPVSDAVTAESELYNSLREAITASEAAGTESATETATDSVVKQPNELADEESRVAKIVSNAAPKRMGRK